MLGGLERFHIGFAEPLHMQRLEQLQHATNRTLWAVGPLRSARCVHARV